MRNKFLLIAALLLLAGGLAVLLLHEYLDPANDKGPAFTEKDLAEAARKHFGQELPALAAPAPINPSRSIRLAIGSLGLAGEENNRRAGDLVLAQLTGAKGLELVERQELDVVLREMSLNVSGLVRAKDAIRVGKLLRADWFLLGSGVSLNGTNYMVVRIVDAQTGVVREAGVFEGNQLTSPLASALAGFVRQCRLNAAEAKSPVYLSVGAFEDLSVNNRQAALPSQLRAYLTAAYRGVSVTMLEREFANNLLQEMRLDLAGLTDEAGSNAPAMQAAYWMVEGYYQSYESAELEVELVLNVQRMFGRKERLAIREKPGEPLFQRIKQSIDEVMSQDQSALVWSRMTEVRAQLFAGKELVGIRGDDHLDYIWVSYQGYGSISENEMARRIRNTEEAVRAFETVLLLDPDNREARMCLATCFRRTLIQRTDEARDYYREIIDAPAEDRWTDVARQALLETWRYDPESQRQWLENAARSTSNPSAAAFYRTQAERAAEDVTIGRGGTSKAEELAEARLFEDIESFDNVIHGKNGTSSFAIGIDDYAKLFGKDKPRVARQLADLYPRMKARFPDAAPYLLATIVTFQVETNAPIISEFERTLEWCLQNPQRVVGRPTEFWSHIRYEPYSWALRHKRTDLAVKILEAVFRAASTDAKASRSWSSDEDKMALAYGYLAMERWKDALPIFESYTNRPVPMGNSGPWGRAFSIILPREQAALCREKLGLPPVVDPREFRLGDPCLHLHGRSRREDRSVSAMDSTGFWIALNDQLMHVGFDLQTNFSVELPRAPFASPSALSVGESNLWVGTAGGGLLEVDKATGGLRHFAVKDGLLMDYVSGLHLARNTLWIGYGNESGGGMGRLDLTTRKFASFTASIASESDERRPPREQTTDIRTGPEGELWFLVKSAPWFYRPSENRWELQPERSGVRRDCYWMDGELLVEALTIEQVEVTMEGIPKGAGETNQMLKITQLMSVEDRARMSRELRSKFGRNATSSTRSVPKWVLESDTFPAGRRQRFLEAEGFLTQPTALTVHGREVWVGGAGFVALVDLDQDKIKKIAYVPAAAVDQIQIGGNFLWVQFDHDLYRVALSQLR